MMDIPATLGERIVEARKRVKIKQKDLAAAIGVSPTVLNYYEKNKREPNINTLAKLAEELDVSIEYLMGVEDIEAREMGMLLRQGRYSELEEFAGLPKGTIFPISEEELQELLAKFDALPKLTDAALKGLAEEVVNTAQQIAADYVVLSPEDQEEVRVIIEMKKARNKKGKDTPDE